MRGWRSTLIKAKGRGDEMGDLWRRNQEGGYHSKCKQVKLLIIKRDKRATKLKENNRAGELIPR